MNPQNFNFYNGPLLGAQTKTEETSYDQTYLLDILLRRTVLHREEKR